MSSTSTPVPAGKHTKKALEMQRLAATPSDDPTTTVVLQEVTVQYTKNRNRRTSDKEKERNRQRNKKKQEKKRLARASDPKDSVPEANVQETAIEGANAQETVEETVIEEPAMAQPAALEPLDEEPCGEEPSTQESPSEEPLPEEHVNEHSTSPSASHSRSSSAERPNSSGSEDPDSEPELAYIKPVEATVAEIEDCGSVDQIDPSINEEELEELQDESQEKLYDESQDEAQTATSIAPYENMVPSLEEIFPDYNEEEEILQLEEFRHQNETIGAGPSPVCQEETPEPQDEVQPITPVAITPIAPCANKVPSYEGLCDGDYDENEEIFQQKATHRQKENSVVKPSATSYNYAADLVNQHVDMSDEDAETYENFAYLAPLPHQTFLAIKEWDSWVASGGNYLEFLEMVEAKFPVSVHPVLKASQATKQNKSWEVMVLANGVTRRFVLTKDMAQWVLRHARADLATFTIRNPNPIGDKRIMLRHVEERGMERYELSDHLMYTREANPTPEGFVERQYYAAWGRPGWEKLPVANDDETEALAWNLKRNDFVYADNNAEDRPETLPSWPKQRVYRTSATLEPYVHRKSPLRFEVVYDEPSNNEEPSNDGEPAENQEPTPMEVPTSEVVQEEPLNNIEQVETEEAERAEEYPSPEEPVSEEPATKEAIETKPANDVEPAENGGLSFPEPEDLEPFESSDNIWNRLKAPKPERVRDADELSDNNIWTSDYAMSHTPLRFDNIFISKVDDKPEADEEEFIDPRGIDGTGCLPDVYTPHGSRKCDVFEEDFTMNVSPAEENEIQAALHNRLQDGLQDEDENVDATLTTNESSDFIEHPEDDVPAEVPQTPNREAPPASLTDNLLSLLSPPLTKKELENLDYVKLAARLGGQVQKERAKLEEERAEQINLAVYFDSANERNNRLNAELLRLMDRAGKANELKAELEATKTMLDKKLEELDECRADAEQARADNEAAADHRKRKLDKLQEELHGANERIRELQSRLVESDALAHKLTHKEKELQETISIKDDLAEANSDNEELRDQITKAKATIAKTKSHMECENNAHDLEVSSLKAELQRKEQQISHLRAQIQQKEKEKQRLCEQAQAAMSIAEEHHAYLSGTQAQLGLKDHLLAVKDAELEDTRSQLTTTQDSFASMDELLNVINTELPGSEAEGIDDVQNNEKTVEIGANPTKLGMLGMYGIVIIAASSVWLCARRLI